MKLPSDYKQPSTDREAEAERQRVRCTNGTDTVELSPEALSACEALGKRHAARLNAAYQESLRQQHAAIRAMGNEQ